MDEHWLTSHDDVVEVWQADNGEWRFHVIAPNHEVVEQGEGYKRRDRCVEAAERHHPRVDLPD